MPDKTTLPGRQTTTDGPVHIREVIAEVLAWHGIAQARAQNRPATIWPDERSIAAVPAGAGCR